MMQHQIEEKRGEAASNSKTPYKENTHMGVMAAEALSCWVERGATHSGDVWVVDMGRSVCPRGGVVAEGKAFAGAGGSIDDVVAGVDNKEAEPVVRVTDDVVSAETESAGGLDEVGKGTGLAMTTTEG